MNAALYRSCLHSSKDASKESILFGSFIGFASHRLCIIPQNNSNPIIAYVMITNMTSNAMCNNGIIALRIEFNTT